MAEMPSACGFHFLLLNKYFQYVMTLPRVAGHRLDAKVNGLSLTILPQFFAAPPPLV
jgi:hypothetical protein